MQKYSYQDIKKLEDLIREKRKPIKLKIQNQSIPLVLTKTAQLKLINKGFVCLTTNQLWKLIKDCENVEEQRQKVLIKAKNMQEGIEIAFKVKEIFDGEIVNFR